MKSKLKKRGPLLDTLAFGGQLGLTMAGSIGLGLFIGYKLDKWLGTKGLFIIIFIILGIIGGGVKIYIEINKSMDLKPKADSRPKKKNGRD